MNNLSSCPPPFICLLRHGNTFYSENRRYNGLTDVPLTPTGEAAARGLAPILSSIHWDLVLCSPLIRAMRTAELAGFLSPELVPELVEFNYGEYEEKTTEEIFALRSDWDLWRDGCPQGDTPNSAAARLRPLLPRLLDRGGAILIFSHSHTIRILSALMLGLESQQGAIFSIEPSRLNLIRIHRGRPEIALWNDGGHIP